MKRGLGKAVVASILLVVLLGNVAAVSWSKAPLQGNDGISNLLTLYDEMDGGDGLNNNQISTFLTLYDCRENKIKSIGACMSKGASNVNHPRSYVAIDQLPHNNVELDNVPKDDGSISWNVEQQPSDSKFKLGSAPSLEFHAHDGRPVSFEKRFYDSDLSIEVKGPNDNTFKEIKRTTCDKQQTRDCSISLNKDTSEFVPKTKGEYSFRVVANANDGAQSSITKTYSGVIRGEPESAPRLSEAGYGDWDAEWETKDGRNEKLWFAVNEDNNVVIDTEGSGICGKAIMKKEVSIPSGGSKQISFDYKLKAEDLAGKVGIWAGLDQDILDPEEDVSVAPSQTFSRTDKWHTWSVTLKNEFYPNEITETVEVGLKDGDDHCGLLSKRKGVYLEIKGEDTADELTDEEIRDGHTQ